MNSRIKKIEDEIRHEKGRLNIETTAGDGGQGLESAVKPQKWERPGAILKKAREAQGLSIEIVHEATKIPLDVLRAIEEGYKVRLLSPFYFNGFVKLYANYVNVDVSEVIEDFKTEAIPEPKKQNYEEFEMPRWIGAVFTRERLRQGVILAVILAGLFIVTKTTGFIASRISAGRKQKSEHKTEPAKKAIKQAAVIQGESAPLPTPETPKLIAPKITPPVTVKEEPLAVASPVSLGPQPVLPPAIPVQPVIEKNITLTVRANQNSWLRIRTDGETVFQSTLRIGAVETWLADEEIEISGRNIDHLDFELNGKLIGKLGRKDRNAKKIVITKDGLSVKQ